MKRITYILCFLLFHSSSYAFWPFSVDHTTIANNMIKRGKYDTAIQYIEKRLNENKGSVGVEIKDDYFLLGISCFLLEREEEAQKYFKRVIEIDAKSYRALFFLGKIYLKKAKYEQARLQFSEALNILNTLKESDDSLDRTNNEKSIILCYLMMTELCLGNIKNGIIYAETIYNDFNKYNSSLFWACNLMQITSKNEYKKCHYGKDENLKIRSAILDSITYFSAVRIASICEYPKSIPELCERWKTLNISDMQ